MNYYRNENVLELKDDDSIKLENRVKELLVDRPYVYSVQELAEALYADPYDTKVAVKFLHLNHLIKKTKHANLTKGDKLAKEIIQFAKENPLKFKVQEYATIFKCSQVTVYKIIREHSLGSLIINRANKPKVIKLKVDKPVITRTNGVPIKYIPDYEYFIKFVTDNPRKFSLQELTKILGFTSSNINNWVTKHRLKRFIRYHFVDLENDIVNLVKQEPNVYTISSLQLKFKVSYNFTNKVVNKNNLRQYLLITDYKTNNKVLSLIDKDFDTRLKELGYVAKIKELIAEKRLTNRGIYKELKIASKTFYHITKGIKKGKYE
jgi:hypothetical protein